MSTMYLTNGTNENGRNVQTIVTGKTGSGKESKNNRAENEPEWLLWEENLSETFR